MTAHAITNVDEATKQGDCAACGRVAVYTHGGWGAWECVSAALARRHRKVYEGNRYMGTIDPNTGEFRPAGTLARTIAERIQSLPERERRRITTITARREGFPKRMRLAIIERAGGRCELRLEGCGGDAYPRELLQAHHIDADGPHSLDNGQAACPNCHVRVTREETE